VRVEDAHGAAPGIPFWRGEAPGRDHRASQEVSALRERRIARDGAADWLVAECGLDGAARNKLWKKGEGRVALGVLPATHTHRGERFSTRAVECSSFCTPSAHASIVPWGWRYGNVAGLSI
jgi:ATP-dependent Lhr-like helicase